MITNARRWRLDVAQGLQAETELGDARCRWLIYEELWAEPVKVLQALFSWLGLTVEIESLQGFVESFRPPQTLPYGNGGTGAWGDLASKPKGFFGGAGVDGWREQLSTRQIRAVEYITGELMDRLGYQPHGLLPSGSAGD